ncbi:esterase-like activity of phytase family protein [Sedimentitalea todarodis]|uniref:Esterase-like activity of phytase family protein n=1 Tax=Sedimentitalea todarodis TaxID=1631240 RepID=A0ABU3VIX8_9RHOB|nr:esterase-like activity of phytase family protein [Sedimentitalea todarodis]MDU9006152.1 esterase-like activity of phytase family protein [Sedimentitalea todarodis]
MRLGPALQLILALTLAALPARSEEVRAEFLGSFEWAVPQRWFGGLSGIELSEDGQRMAVITDRGRILYANVRRKDGVIQEINLIRVVSLRAHNGAVLIGRLRDSEGLVVAPDGTVYVSFEGIHRVSRYRQIDRASESLNRPKAFRLLPNNGGFEALAMDDRQRLLALPEQAFDIDGNIPVYRWADDVWTQPFCLPSDGAFLPVGADFGPDGRLYVLERAYNIFGFRSRVRSWRIADDRAVDERIEIQTRTGTHDNLEGISVWQDTRGRLRLTMVADDNFLFLQRTEFVEYALIK